MLLPHHRISVSARVASLFVVGLGLVGLGLAGCLPAAPAYQTASPAEIQAQQRAAMAQSLGYPTRKSPAELEQVIAQQTKDFQPTGRRFSGQLEAPAPLVIEGVRGTCYTFVIRLAADAAWGLGAESGVRFDFRAPTGPGSGGPGVTGPGAVASVGCAEAAGPISLTMAPMIGADPLGRGAFTAELWSHVLTREEAAHLEADKQRQIEEQREFARRQAEEQQRRESAGCAKCDARYQGCIGAGRSRDVCQSDYRSCAFREAGASYLSVCPNPSF